MNITDNILEEFKEKMHFGDDEDTNLLRILSASIVSLKKACGDYDITKDEDFKELVFERSRYVYNDALEYFTQNFLTEITNLNLGKALEKMVIEDDTDAAI
jgi:hypothetical protein